MADSCAEPRPPRLVVRSTRALRHTKATLGKRSGPSECFRLRDLSCRSRCRRPRCRDASGSPHWEGARRSGVRRREARAVLRPLYTLSTRGHARKELALNA
eukprot:scaffold10025_cov119-Isochrysis_galbana.AAC.2